ncbi:MAG: class I SAM-dependent methyltransferase [Gammaproteobacteria bacterium]
MFDRPFGIAKTIARRGLQRLPDRVRDFMVRSLVPAEASASQQTQELHSLRRELDTALADGGELARRYKELERAATVLQPFMDAQATAPQFVPPGHFYSPVPPLAEVRARASRIFDRNRRAIAGVALREAEQLALLERFAVYYRDQPFTATQHEDRRYFFENQFYSYSDALFLHCMLRDIRPKRVIEVGSGFSSAATLDTCELFLDNEVNCTFIEPYPDLLRSILKPGDSERIHIIEEPLQDVPVSLFEGLAANDILFIDSTHVSRVGSDVNYIFFEVLPALRPWVVIHFHDVFWPFEYPESWIEEGRQWHEDYVLRAFLEFNQAFEIVVFNTFLETFHSDWFEKYMPLCLKDRGGSIWLRRCG